MLDFFGGTGGLLDNAYQEDGKGEQVIGLIVAGPPYHKDDRGDKGQ